MLPSAGRPAVRRWLRAAFWIGFVLACGCLLYVADPAGPSCYPPCPVHYLTGLHCPGCGSLRAAHQLLHGHLVAALGLNPLMVLSVPFLAYTCVAGGLRSLGWSALPRRRLPAWMIWSLLGLILAYWVLRNIPVSPLNALAP